VACRHERGGKGGGKKEEKGEISTDIIFVEELPLHRQPGSRRKKKKEEERKKADHQATFPFGGSQLFISNPVGEEGKKKEKEGRETHQSVPRHVYRNSFHSRLTREKKEGEKEKRGKERPSAFSNSRKDLLRPRRGEGEREGRKRGEKEGRRLIESDVYFSPGLAPLVHHRRAEEGTERREVLRRGKCSFS